LKQHLNKSFLCGFAPSRLCVILFCEELYNQTCICWWTERAGRAKDKVAPTRRFRQETTMLFTGLPND
jgi:hypothetical protein